MSAEQPGYDEPFATRWRRRAISLSGVVVLGVLALAALPLTVLAGFVLDLIRGGRSSMARSIAFITLYIATEAFVIVLSFPLWLLFGGPFARRTRGFQTVHHAIQYVWGERLLALGMWFFNARIVPENVDVVRARGKPLVILSRHASLADTLLPLALLGAPSARRLRYVMKRELLWDPAIDVYGSRLPNYFVARGAGDAGKEAARMAVLAKDLPGDSAVVLFPEGTRFTPKKRERVLARLRAGSDKEALARAVGLTHMLPIRTRGIISVLEHAPDADIVLWGHHGLEGVTGFRDLANGRLRNRDIRVKAWVLPAASLPATIDERLAIIQDEWMRIDAWIDELEKTEAA